MNLKNICLLIVLSSFCVVGMSAHKVSKPDTVIIADTIHEKILLKLEEIHQFQEDIQLKKEEDISIFKQNQENEGKSEIGIMAQIEDNTHEKFVSSGWTLLALVSLGLSVFTFWFQQRTEKHTKNVSIAVQLGTLKDLPRHFYRNLVCTVAMLIKFRDDENRHNERFKSYPSEANMLKLQTLPEEFILAVDTGNDELSTVMHEQKLLFKNYNVEVKTASEHFSRNNLTEKTFGYDYDNILYKPIALIKGMQEFQGMLEAYAEHEFLEGNFPSVARKLKNWGLMTVKKADKEAFVCEVITTFVREHFKKLDFKKIKNDLQKRYWDKVISTNNFETYITYQCEGEMKNGILRSLNGLLELITENGTYHFLKREKVSAGEKERVDYIIKKEDFKNYFFQRYDGKREEHPLEIITVANDASQLASVWGIREQQQALKEYFEFWKQDKWSVKDLLYTLLKMDAILELPVIGMVEHPENNSDA